MEKKYTKRKNGEGKRLKMREGMEREREREEKR